MNITPELSLKLSDIDSLNKGIELLTQFKNELIDELKNDNCFSTRYLKSIFKEWDNLSVIEKTILKESDSIEVYSHRVKEYKEKHP